MPSAAAGSNGNRSSPVVATETGNTSAGEPQDTAHLQEEELEKEEEEPVTYRLPLHRKCACHRLSLVATTDVAGLQGTLKKTSVQTFAKLSGLWNKQNRSVPAANAIKAALGILLVTPCETRWNSYYDAVSKVNAILSDPEQEVKFDCVCDQLGIKHLLPSQKKFVAEYVMVMKPVCDGLDKLQGERDVGLGYLLPTLSVMLSKLNKLLQPDESTNLQKLSICEPLVHALKRGIRARFDELANDKEAELAAVVNPKFKMDWVDDQTEKSRLTLYLKQRVIGIATSSASSLASSGDANATATLAGGGDSHGSTALPASTDEDYFAELRAKRIQEAQQAAIMDDSKEVTKYLADTATTLSILNSCEFPNIKKLYIALNTGLPASAAVERLCSLGGRVFTPLRTRMSILK